MEKNMDLDKQIKLIANQNEQLRKEVNNQIEQYNHIQIDRNRLNNEMILLKSDNERYKQNINELKTQVEHLNNDRNTLTTLLESKKKNWDINDQKLSV